MQRCECRLPGDVSTRIVVLAATKGFKASEPVRVEAKVCSRGGYCHLLTSSGSFAQKEEHMS